MTKPATRFPGKNITTPSGASARITSHLAVTAVYVPRSSRGRGLGRELMAEVLSYADSRGLTLHLTAQAFDVSLTEEELETGHVGPDTDALEEWYRRLGFEGSGRLSREPR